MESWAVEFRMGFYIANWAIKTFKLDLIVVVVS